jgi:hypothetical protein
MAATSDKRPDQSARKRRRRLVPGVGAAGDRKRSWLRRVRPARQALVRALPGLTQRASGNAAGLTPHKRQLVTGAFHQVPDGRTTRSMCAARCREAMMISPARCMRYAVPKSIGASGSWLHKSRDSRSRGRVAIGVQTPQGRSMVCISSLIAGQHILRPVSQWFRTRYHILFVSS